jgi:signal transduction histidine kinase
MPPFRSLLGRIAGLHILALLAATIAVPLAAYFLLSATATGYERNVLQAHADTIASYIVRRPDGKLALDLPPDLKTFYAHHFGGFDYAVVDQHGNVISSSLAGRASVMPGQVGSQEPRYVSRPTATASYAMVSIPIAHAGMPVWVQLGEDLGHPDVIFDDIVADFLSKVVWITIPIMLLLLLADIIAVRGALRPVVRISEMARSIGPTHIGLRLPTRDLPLEVLPLVKAINQGLDRLEEGLKLQREFTADAAHELRTPLAVLRTRLDMLPAQEGLSELKRDLEKMSHVVGQLLEVGEIEAMAIDPSETAELNAVCAEVAALIAPIAVAQNKDLALTAGAAAVRVKGNAAMLFQAVRNLVENAVAHTPIGSTVEIVVDKAGKIRVLDQGPGIPYSERELIFRRFWRRDRSRTSGAGLGLSIVSRIAEAHGGSIEVENAPGRGAVFTLSLRAASSER